MPGTKQTDWTPLDQLFETIESRKTAAADESYVAHLYAKGRKKIAQKLGEEAVETALAAVLDDRPDMIAESADLLFHLLVLWADAGLHPSDILAELARREGLSGLEEKARRPS
ncbi:phosphoribosyl-ATP pyrophosphatase [Iodidimonas gelatinilytica]|uniref:Phosphoribosyl-ATP pyrophosphatase n=1 Tax=Iodidimonas gelatinilytica TaxID=1236966 RepID=A0A5A7MRH1_9PROT|nr:phosphoribosyl-ATP diphosphatase [Iodidimonas gelatinilytica]GEQ97479.1 phosphoribosyl-ATP pyrophosphatase [Iodidimonas gelatinilytica]